MSTRSAIVLKMKGGTFAGIYCHNDGYPSGVGKTLLEHYKEPEKIRQLIELGDLSSLDERVEPVGPHGFGRGETTEPEPGTTVAYMRDRGEKDCVARTSKKLKEVLDKIDHEYAYVFADGSWTCNGKPLAEVVAAH